MCVGLWNKITVSKQLSWRGKGRERGGEGEGKQYGPNIHAGVIKDEGSGFRRFERFLTVGDEKNLLEDFEVQAWANDLTEEDPLLGCNIKVNSFF